MTQLDIYPYATSLNHFEDYPDNNDYIKLIWSIGITVISLVVGGFIFFITKNKLVFVAMVGSTYVLLTFYSIPYGLMGLFALLSIENAIILSEGFTISKIAGVVILLSFSFRLLISKLVLPDSFGTMSLFVGWAGFSILWSIFPFTVNLMFWLTLVLNLGLVFIMTNAIKDKKVLFVVSSGLILGAFVSSVLVASGYVVEYSGYAAKIGRASLQEGSDPVTLAFSLTLGAVVLVHVAFRGGLLKKIFAGILFMLIFYANFKTQSRTPLACSVVIPVVAFIMCAAKGKRFKYLLIAFALSIVALISLKMLYKSNLLSDAARERFTKDDLVSSGRLYFWSMAVSFFMERPLTGWGVGNYPARSLMIGEGYQAAHNSLLSIMAELGIPGLIVFVVLHIKLLRATMKIKDLQIRWIAVAMLMFAVLSGTTVTHYFKKSFWYSLGLTVVAINLAKNKTEQEYEVIEDDMFQGEQYYPYYLDGKDIMAKS
ncbi:MAG: O-antigen ligase family protein [Phycisphaerae bacterium]